MAVRIIDTLATQNDNSFPIALANDIKGGIHSVVNLEYRNNIAEERLEEGMLCYVQSERQMFQYVDGEWGVFTHGSVICDTYDELIRVVTDKLTLGTIAYVSNDVNGKFMYYLSVIGWKSFDLANGRIYIGDTEPEDKSLIWFDTTDESVETMSFPEESTLRDFQATSNLLLSKTTTLENKINNLKGGTFYNDDTTDNTSGGNYLTFSIKTGSSKNLRQLAEGEMVYCADTGQLWIGVRKSANVSTLTNVCILGGGNVPDNPDEPEWDGYVELTSNANVKYRLLAGADGRLRLHEASYYEAEDPALSDATNYKGLIINRVFGGGDLNADIAPVSHGFIELYNNNPQGLTLNLKGLSVHYKTKSDSVWQKLELEGYLPYQHSFLIRCARHTSDYSANCRLKIKEYDMDWSKVAIAAGGFSVYLGVGRDLILVENPYNYNDTGLKIEGYIDMVALGKDGEADSISAYEGSDGYYPNFGNFHTGVQRIDFTDTDKSYADLEAVDYQKCDVEIYRPHCSTDGAWDLYYNKIKLNPRIPNMINMCYGKEVTTRTFTWQSVVTETGYLRYRKFNSVDWIYVESDKTMISHHDSDATVHRVIIRNLDYGIYEYQAGEEGAWSDLSTFEIIEHNVLDTKDHIKFLQVSDQQGFFESEYNAWKWAIKYIEANEPDENYEFVLNSGDISQNANRSFEWRWYYKYPMFNKTKPHMVSIGNNDLVDKTYSYVFKNYLTYEDEAQIESTSVFPVAGCNSWDIGFVHFVNMNTNVAEDSDLMVKQFNWIKNDMEAARSRTNPPRWFVLVGHHGALSVCRMKAPQQMIPFVEDLNFDVVIFGHHHSYSRSKPVLMNIRDEVEAITGKSIYESSGNAVRNAVYGIGYLEANLSGVGENQTTVEGNAQSANDYINDKEGIYWIMCQATGFKLQSNKDLEKTPTPWWYGYVGEHPYNPSYIMWDFGYNEIKMSCYGVTGIMKYDSKLKSYVLADDITMNDLGKVTYDTLTITHKSLR